MDGRLPAVQPSLSQSRRVCVEYTSPDSLRQDQKAFTLSRILISPPSGPHGLLSNPCPSSEMRNGAAQSLLFEVRRFQCEKDLFSFFTCELSVSVVVVAHFLLNC